MKVKKEKEVELIIIRRHEPDEFLDLMLRLSPVFSEWQATTKKTEKAKSRVAKQRNKL